MRLLKSKSDQELIQMYVGGQESGLEALLNRYKSKIYTSIYMKVKDEYLAEDIFQETFIKIINTLKSGKYNEESKIFPWAIRIAHNMIVDFFRKAKRAPNIVNADGFDIFEVLEFSDESAESKMLKQQVDVDLKKMIQKLPDDQKEVLIMRHFCDMSFKDIAEITEVSINTALGRMRYALSNLRKMIEGTDLTLQMGYL